MYYYFDCIQPLLAESISVHSCRHEIGVGRSQPRGKRATQWGSSSGKNRLQLFVCCRWPSGLSVCVATSSYQRYLCCDNTETDIGFQGFVTSHYPDTETFIALAYCETHADAGVSIVLNTLMVSSARISMRLPW